MGDVFCWGMCCITFQMFVAGVIGSLVGLLANLPPILRLMRLSIRFYRAVQTGLCGLSVLIIYIINGWWLTALIFWGHGYYGYPHNTHIFRFEFWLRIVFPSIFDNTCLSGNQTICDAANMFIVNNKLQWQSAGWIYYILIFLIPGLIAAWVTWYFAGFKQAIPDEKKKRQPPVESELML